MNIREEKKMIERRKETNIPVVIDEVILGYVKECGNSAHIVVPRRHRHRFAYVLILDNLIVPRIHENKTKKHDGKTYVFAEITTNAGVHSLWLKKDTIKDMFTA